MDSHLFSARYLSHVDSSEDDRSRSRRVPPLQRRGRGELNGGDNDDGDDGGVGDASQSLSQVYVRHAIRLDSQPSLSSVHSQSNSRPLPPSPTLFASRDVNRASSAGKHPYPGGAQKYTSAPTEERGGNVNRSVEHRAEALSRQSLSCEEGSHHTGPQEERTEKQDEEQDERTHTSRLRAPYVSLPFMVHALPGRDDSAGGSRQRRPMTTTAATAVDRFRRRRDEDGVVGSRAASPLSSSAPSTSRGNAEVDGGSRSRPVNGSDKPFSAALHMLRRNAFVHPLDDGEGTELVMGPDDDDDDESADESSQHSIASLLQPPQSYKLHTRRMASSPSATSTHHAHRAHQGWHADVVAARELSEGLSQSQQPRQHSFAVLLSRVTSASSLSSGFLHDEDGVENGDDDNVADRTTAASRPLHASSSMATASPIPRGAGLLPSMDLRLSSSPVSVAVEVGPLVSGDTDTNTAAGAPAGAEEADGSRASSPSPSPPSPRASNLVQLAPVKGDLRVAVTPNEPQLNATKVGEEEEEEGSHNAPTEPAHRADRYATVLVHNLHEERKGEDEHPAAVVAPSIRLRQHSELSHGRRVRSGEPASSRTSSSCHSSQRSAPSSSRPRAYQRHRRRLTPSFSERSNGAPRSSTPPPRRAFVLSRVPSVVARAEALESRVSAPPSSPDVHTQGVNVRENEEREEEEEEALLNGVAEAAKDENPATGKVTDTLSRNAGPRGSPMACHGENEEGEGAVETVEREQTMLERGSALLVSEASMTAFVSNAIGGGAGRRVPRSPPHHNEEEPGLDVVARANAACVVVVPRSAGDVQRTAVTGWELASGAQPAEKTVQQSTIRVAVAELATAARSHAPSPPSQRPAGFTAADVFSLPSSLLASTMMNSTVYDPPHPLPLREDDDRGNADEEAQGGRTATPTAAVVGTSCADEENVDGSNTVRQRQQERGIPVASTTTDAEAKHHEVCGEGNTTAAARAHHASALVQEGVMDATRANQSIVLRVTPPLSAVSRTPTPPPPSSLPLSQRLRAGEVIETEPSSPPPSQRGIADTLKSSGHGFGTTERSVSSANHDDAVSHTSTATTATTTTEAVHITASAATTSPAPSAADAAPTASVDGDSPPSPFPRPVAQTECSAAAAVVPLPAKEVHVKEDPFHTEVATRLSDTEERLAALNAVLARATQGTMLAAVEDAHKPREAREHRLSAPREATSFPTTTTTAGALPMTLSTSLFIPSTTSTVLLTECGGAPLPSSTGVTRSLVEAAASTASTTTPSSTSASSLTMTTAGSMWLVRGSTPTPLRTHHRRSAGEDRGSEEEVKEVAVAKEEENVAPLPSSLPLQAPLPQQQTSQRKEAPTAERHGYSSLRQEGQADTIPTELTLPSPPLTEVTQSGEKETPPPVVARELREGQSEREAEARAFAGTSGRSRAEEPQHNDGPVEMAQTSGIQNTKRHGPPPAAAFGRARSASTVEDEGFSLAVTRKEESAGDLSAAHTDATHPRSHAVISSSSNATVASSSSLTSLTLPRDITAAAAAAAGGGTPRVSDEVQELVHKAQDEVRRTRASLLSALEEHKQRFFGSASIAIVKGADRGGCGCCGGSTTEVHTCATHDEDEEAVRRHSPGPECMMTAGRLSLELDPAGREDYAEAVLKSQKKDAEEERWKRESSLDPTTRLSLTLTPPLDSPSEECRTAPASSASSQQQQQQQQRLHHHGTVTAVGCAARAEAASDDAQYHATQAPCVERSLVATPSPAHATQPGGARALPLFSGSASVDRLVPLQSRARWSSESLRPLLSDAADRIARRLRGYDAQEHGVLPMETVLRVTHYVLVNDTTPLDGSETTLSDRHADVSAHALHTPLRATHDHSEDADLMCDAHGMVLTPLRTPMTVGRGGRLPQRGAPASIGSGGGTAQWQLTPSGTNASRTPETMRTTAAAAAAGGGNELRYSPRVWGPLRRVPHTVFTTQAEEAPALSSSLPITAPYRGAETEPCSTSAQLHEVCKRTRDGDLVSEGNHQNGTGVRGDGEENTTTTTMVTLSAATTSRRTREDRDTEEYRRKKPRHEGWGGGAAQLCGGSTPLSIDAEDEDDERGRPATCISPSRTLERLTVLQTARAEEEALMDFYLALIDVFRQVFGERYAWQHIGCTNASKHDVTHTADGKPISDLSDVAAPLETLFPRLRQQYALCQQHRYQSGGSAPTSLLLTHRPPPLDTLVYYRTFVESLSELR